MPGLTVQCLFRLTVETTDLDVGGIDYEAENTGASVRGHILEGRNWKHLD